jgi:hypothetical protein
MKLRSSLFLIGAVAAVLGAASQGCHFQAGVKDDQGSAGTGAAGKISGAAGMSGAAGAIATAGTNGAAGMIGPPLRPCAGLECQQSTCILGDCKVPACKPGEHTTVSGKIFDPAGKTPLYNITVYVPNADLDPINDGPSCDPCDPVTGTSLLSGKPVVIAKTDEKGDFHLGRTSAIEVPAGANIPMVIQVGKWRRQVTIPMVTACQDNVITDMELLHLPRNSQEGHIPKMAITTGEKDALQCLLLKVGVDKKEFTNPDGTGRINIYAGGGGATSYDDLTMFPAANTWWESYDNLAKYDIVLHSCDGGQGDYNLAQRAADTAAGRTPIRGEPAYPKSMAAKMALEKFANMGGRVFASHWHSYWFADGPPSFKSIATWGRQPNGLGPVGTVDQTFQTGAALAQWLVNVGGSVTLGTVDMTQDASNRQIDAAAGGNVSQRWIFSAAQTPQSVAFLSATTPIPGGTCGRAVVSDLHLITGGTGDMPTGAFPTTSCVTTDLAPREKVLEFMLFDIASCVQAIIP